MNNTARKKQNFLEGAAVLGATVIITKIIGAIYKIPIYNLLGDQGTAHFQVTYYIYSVLLAVSTAGLPVAMSRLIAGARALEAGNTVRRYFRVGLTLFAAIGTAIMLLMLLIPGKLASWAGDDLVAPGVVALAPAVLFVCLISAYRGYSQGFSDMRPTAISQILEVVCKLIFGLAIAWILMRRGADSATVSAGAIVGVTIGLGLSVPVLMLYKRRIDESEQLQCEDEAPGRMAVAGELLKVGIPITLSSASLSLINLVDASLTLRRLESGAGLSGDMAQTLYGAYSKAMSLFNLPSAIIVPVTVAIVPAIARALAAGNHGEAKETMESGIKLTNLIAMPCAAGLGVLCVPIFRTLYWESHECGATLLGILGPATFFCCAYLILTAVLQAAGYEKPAMYAPFIGGAIKIAVNWILVGIPGINIYGAPIGTMCCYIAITVFDVIYIKKNLKEGPDFARVCLKPLLCTALMACAAWGVYKVSGIVIKSAGHLTYALRMVLGVGAGVIVYAITIIALGAVTHEDMKLIPKAERLLDKVHIKLK